jgi:NADH:ubiquinone oxidoreductase subunit 6 (subunit J)
MTIKIVPQYKPPKAEVKKPKRFVQFSKRCLGAMIVLWFAGAIFGFTVCSIQIYRGELVSLGEVLAYIGAPMTGGILGYMIKSAWEKQGKKNTEDITYESQI